MCICSVLLCGDITTIIVVIYRLFDGPEIKYTEQKKILGCTITTDTNYTTMCVLLLNPRKANAQMRMKALALERSIAARRKGVNKSDEQCRQRCLSDCYCDFYEVREDRRLCLFTTAPCGKHGHHKISVL